MSVNFFAPVKITKRLLPKMIENGGGTIAVTSGISGKFGFPSGQLMPHQNLQYMDSLKLFMPSIIT